jgi:choline dehydrogenase-like flavoprotein
MNAAFDGVPDGLVDAASVPAGRTYEATADVVVIGSGAAGAAAAKALTDAGLEVVIVEEGPWVPPSAYKRDTWGAFQQLWRDGGFQAARGQIFLPILQGVAVGGSTPINGAIVHRIPEPILAGWQSEHGWDTERFGATALARAYDQLDALLSVAPAPEHVLGGNNLRMRDACEAMGIEHHAIRRNVRGCDGSVRCLQGCPKGRKQSMNVTFIPDALRKGARLLARCRVDKIAPRTAHPDRWLSVLGSFRIDGRRHAPVRLYAKRAVVVAASAIQTPQLLAASGIGRSSRRVGERLQCHPGSSVMGVFDTPVEMWFGATQGYESVHWWDERMKFETVGMPIEVAGARMPGFGVPLMRRIAEFGHVAQWGVQIRARAHGRVRRRFWGTDIAYDLTTEDVRSLKLGLDRAMQMMFAAGARRVYPGIHGMPEEIRSVDEIARLHDLPDTPRLFHGIASHMFGTATMGRDPRTGVVGPDLQCFDAPGVYVVDSSVFPTNLGVNPAHTISTFAWLAAEQIADAS